MTFFEEYKKYETRNGSVQIQVSRPLHEQYRLEERKDYAAQLFYDDRQLEAYPEHVITDRLLCMVFDTRGQLVQSLIDGELHVLRVNIERERWYEHGFPGYRYTVYCDHRIAPKRTLIDTQLVPDLMSAGELWHEFWRRVNRKRKAFGLLWMFDEFLQEMERVQGWR